MTNTTITATSSRSITGAWVPAAVAGVSATVLAVYQVVTPGAPGASFESASDWLREGMFATYLVAAILATLAGARAEMVRRTPAGLLVAGYSMILVGVTIGMLLRDDPDWFMLLGGPGVLLSTAGFVAWAVVGWRRGTLPGAVAILCGVGGPVAILGSELGLSVLAGAFWIWVSARLRS
jgi:hypothetical protein